MHTRFHLRRFFPVLLPGIVLFFLSAGLVLSQETPLEPSPEPVKVVAAENAKTETVREQTIYIPYEKLRKTFEKSGRGVFLPYEEFRELWDAAQAAKEKPTPVAVDSPVPFMISETLNEANISEEIVQVETLVRIELLKEGWSEIPLRLNNVAITKATIGEEPAKLRGSAETGYTLLIEGKRGESSAETNAETPKTPFSQSLELKLHYAKAIEKSPGRNGVAFEVPQAPISRWKVRVPESGVKIDFFPLIAATEIQAKAATLESKEEETPQEQQEGETVTETPAEAAPKSPESNETVLLAFAGGTSTVRIGWTPKTEGATGLDALTSVQIEEKVQIEEGLVRTEARLDYTISRSQIERLAIEVPADQKVVEVFDANIRQWSVGARENSQVINIELFEPAKERQRIVLKFEKYTGEDSENASESADSNDSGNTNRKTSIAAPLIKALDVARQQGMLLVSSSEELNLEVSKSLGLLQMDTAELPQALRNVNWDYAYRISGANYSLEISTEKVLPRITAATQSQLTFNVDRGSVFMNVTALYDIERSGVFQLTCDVPDGYQVTSVHGTEIRWNNASGAHHYQAAQVDSHHLSPLPVKEGEKATHQLLTVNLSRKAMGKVAFVLQLTKAVPSLELKQGEQSDDNQVGADVEIVTPRITGRFVQSCEGRLGVQVAPNLRLTQKNLLAMQSLPVEQLRIGWIGNMPAFVLAYAYAQESGTVELNIERRKPHVTIRQTLQVRVENGVARFTDKIDHTVLHSGVKAFRIDIPQSIAEKVRSQNPNVRDVKMTPQPKDLAEGYVAYSFETGSDFLGNGQFTLSWEEELKQLDVGKKVTITVPRLQPRNVDRSFGQILISKAPTLDLSETETTSGLRAIDPQHDVNPADQIPDAAAAFEFFDDWSLELLATRYKNEQLKKTSIERGVLQIVSVRNSKNLTARAMYRIRSVKQRLGLELPESALINDVRINGNAVSLESDPNSEGKRYMIPLNSATPDTPFALELRYTYPGSTAKLEIPQFPGEAISYDDTETQPESKPAPREVPAIQEMNLFVYLPEDEALTHYTGPWSPHFRYSYGFPTMRVDNDRDSSEIISKILLGANSSHFPVAGSLYMFSTLQPEDSPQSALRISSAKANHVKIAVHGLIIMIGLLLCPLGWPRRLQITLALAIAVVLWAIFYPSLASFLWEQVVFGQTLVLVLMLWCLVSLVRLFRKVRTAHVDSCDTKTAEESTPENESSGEKAEEPSVEPAQENENEKGGQ